MYYQHLTPQQQVNDIIGICISLMVISMIFSMIGRMLDDLFPAEIPRLLPQTKVVTVICPLCGKEIEIPEYNAVTRSEALRRHIEREHRHSTADLLPQNIPDLASIADLLVRVQDAGDELGGLSLVELVGWGRADRLVRVTLRELEREWGYHEARGQAENLQHSPLSTVESWLEAGGYAHDHPLLHGVAQTVVEAAEARIERAKAALPPEAIADINYRISQRTSYGLREETAHDPGVVIVWSNASAEWYAARPVRKGERLTLDANQVFVPYPKRRVKAVLHKLEHLPLYRYSYESVKRKKKEAERLGIEGRMESDERWVRGLQTLGLVLYAGEGYAGTIPIPHIDDVAGLEHIGGGNLSDGKRVYRLRFNPETGTRFYVLEEVKV